MGPRRFPEHLVNERIWGFVEDDPPNELTTATSISPTTDWVSENSISGVDSGRIWGRVVDLQPTTVSSKVKDLVREQIEKVKVTVWETATNLVIEESGSTLSKEQIVSSSTTDSDKTIFSTTTTIATTIPTTIPTTTPRTRVAEVTLKDYRVFDASDFAISLDDLHWSHYLLIGFACLAFLVCMAQGLTCLYICLARKNNPSGLSEVKIVCGKKKPEKPKQSKFKLCAGSRSSKRSLSS